MSHLPDTTRILLGPGPSLTSPRVMREMATPTVSHLDPLMMALLDDIRQRAGDKDDGFIAHGSICSTSLIPRSDDKDP